MALGDRQQGEIAYLRSALGVDELEERLAKLEGNEEYAGRGLEERHSRGLANMANLEKYGATPYYPEGVEPPEDEEQSAEMQGVVDQSDVSTESNPATEGVEIDLDEYMNEEKADNYDEWTVNQLKAELASRGQPVSGTKAELIDRLEQGDE